MRTFEELHELHKRLWGWLAETGKGKSDWPEWTFNGGTVDYNAELCFACEADSLSGEGDCDKCPVEWVPNFDDGCCTMFGSLFDEWEVARDRNNTEEAKRLAGIIRDLPWRKK